MTLRLDDRFGEGRAPFSAMRLSSPDGSEEPHMRAATIWRIYQWPDFVVFWLGERGNHLAGVQARKS
ncbi:MAG: hypothetical protein C3F11_10175 [Methylocystaceae bacterium]|nr:MAG: hypothetical protein C3F11_10175 [Methylocystaceae bacterium]